MNISDAICTECGAGYLRAEFRMLARAPEEGRFNCSACGATLETWSDAVSPVYRLTIRPLSPSFVALHQGQVACALPVTSRSTRRSTATALSE
jgi:hypothetical protein